MDSLPVWTAAKEEIFSVQREKGSCGAAEVETIIKKACVEYAVSWDRLLKELEDTRSQSAALQAHLSQAVDTIWKLRTFIEELRSQLLTPTASRQRLDELLEKTKPPELM